jgi:hypothetical protein
MTLEFSLYSPLILPRFLQAQKDESRRDIHWVGQKSDGGQNQNAQGGMNNAGPKRPDPRGYRDLASVTLGEVNDAYKHFASQLQPTTHESWVAANYFCMLHLVRKRDGRPPAIFGRVRTCYPSDGYIHNIQDMELLLPHRDGAPDVIYLQVEDILHQPNKPVESYYIGVKFLASPEDIADFKRFKALFTEQGFFPDFQTGYIELLEMNEFNHGSLPWIYVIGSRWFATIPESVQPEIRASLLNLLRWNRTVLNYHPERLPSGVRTLNRELGFKAGFTETFLIEPEDTGQTLQKVVSTFDRIFGQPIG